VDVEVKAGQIVYRKMSKISTTPLRRSPRKNLSPLKESYLAESAGSGRSGRRSGGAQKLFSPLGPADFLEPPASGSNKSPRKLIPSPVKFRVAADEVITNCGIYLFNCDVYNYRYIQSFFILLKKN
jgi:hypothetical protein